MVTSYDCGYSLEYLVRCISQLEASTSPFPWQPPGIYTFKDWLVQIPHPLLNNSLFDQKLL